MLKLPLIVTGCIAALAATNASAEVIPGDTFNFSLSGCDPAYTHCVYLAPRQTAEFGTTTTYAGIGFNGQDITISSAQTFGVGTVTDSFIVSTPSSFISTPTADGVTINQIFFTLGGGSGGSDPVNLLFPTGPYTTAGSVLYGSGTTRAITPGTTTYAGRTAFSFVESFDSGLSQTAINALKVRRFTYSITYGATSAIPEPGIWAMMLAGFGLVGGLARRRGVGHRRLVAAG